VQGDDGESVWQEDDEIITRQSRRFGGYEDGMEWLSFKKSGKCV
jgi:hypothetical protein